MFRFDRLDWVEGKHVILGVHGLVALGILGYAGAGFYFTGNVAGLVLWSVVALMVVFLGVMLYRLRQKRDADADDPDLDLGPGP